LIEKLPSHSRKTPDGRELKKKLVKCEPNIIETVKLLNAGFSFVSIWSFLEIHADSITTPPYFYFEAPLKCPCVGNGGICVASGGKLVCQCLNGWSGEGCNVPSGGNQVPGGDPCVPNPCKNGEYPLSWNGKCYCQAMPSNTYNKIKYL
jgi:hypothetical protein